MAAGLAGGYGTLGAFAGRYLYPSSAAPVAWQFVAIAREVVQGEAVHYVTPSGAKVVVARQRDPVGAEEDSAENFIALSSVCPHLGCQVHWEQQNDRFFCPCHNGVFNPQGQATDGPPAKAHQELQRFPLKIQNGLLMIEAPLSAVVQADAATSAHVAAAPDADAAAAPKTEET
ncbi:MAG: Rieske (2Fe-2S) protein [Planctomycetales bacterium]|nr:Rieske (2Fe-2S) protein [Planctomycetales bacterium]